MNPDHTPKLTQSDLLNGSISPDDAVFKPAEPHSPWDGC